MKTQEKIMKIKTNTFNSKPNQTTVKKKNIWKILFLTTLFWGISNHIFAEKVVGSYFLSYFNKEYNIEASEIENGKFHVYIQVSGERESTNVMISIKNVDLEEFNNFLLLVKEKFIEWKNVAEQNNVKDMNKEMNFKSPKTTICWLGTKWYFSFGHRLNPNFIVFEDGRSVVSFYKKVTASSNQYIDQKIYWVFSEPSEIDELISQLNIDTITAKLQETDKSKDLFE